MLRVMPFMSVLAIGIIACGGTEGTREMNDEEASFDREEELERRLEARRGAPARLPERVPEESAAPIVGEVPESLLASMKEDLADKLSISVDDIEVVRSEALTWNDGSLGCPRPGEVYTQALVPGYRVILEHAGRQYDYHATERGYFFLCERPTALRPSAVTE